MKKIFYLVLVSLLAAASAFSDEKIDEFNSICEKAAASEDFTSRVFIGKKEFNFTSEEEFSKILNKNKKKSFVVLVTPDNDVAEKLKNAFVAMAVENIDDKYFSSENYHERIEKSKRVVVGVYFDKIYSISKVDGIIEVLEFQRTVNEKYGYGRVTDIELEMIKKNEAAGFGPYTDAQLDQQRSDNKSKGMGEITDSEVTLQKEENEKAGFGSYTDAELNQQRIDNNASGLGELTDSEVALQKEENEKAGFGAYTDVQLDQQRADNNANGFGEITDSEAALQRDENNKSGYGLITNAEVEAERLKNSRLGLGNITDFEIEIKKKSMLDEIENLRNSKKTYHVFRKYAELADIEKLQEKKSDASSTFELMKKAISSGEPGLGTYDDFTKHDEWVLLLKDVERYHAKVPAYVPVSKEVVKSKTDMATKTFTYNVELREKIDELFEVVKEGFSRAYVSDWNDIPEKWPSVSIYAANIESRKLLTEPPAMVYEPVASYLIDGIPMMEFIAKKSTIVDAYRNGIKEINDRFSMMTDPWEKMGFAYAVGDKVNNMEADVKKLSDSKYSYISVLPLFSTVLSEKHYGNSITMKVVDKNGKMLLRGKKQPLDFDKSYVFEGISSDISSLIESGDASVVLDSIFFKYGKVDTAENMDKLPEVKIEYN